MSGYDGSVVPLRLINGILEKYLDTGQFAVHIS
jgi:hypothetical protein